MVFKLFGEIATSSKTTPYSMPYFAIITFNSYSKKLTNTLLAVFKSSDEIGTSSRTLMRMFQKETGLSYRAWVQQMHIAHALSKIASGESVAQKRVQSPIRTFRFESESLACVV